MDIVVIDGQGGGLGKEAIECIKKHFDCRVIGVGTNSIASSNLKRGGADVIATGENAIIYNAMHASIIVAPIGVAFANSMFGEISPAMASAISASQAKKFLIPISKCHVSVIGVSKQTIPQYLELLITELEKYKNIEKR